MTLVSFRNNFQPHTQHTVYGWKLHSCYWMSLLFFSAGSNTTYYGQQPAFCNACDDIRQNWQGFQIVCQVVYFTVFEYFQFLFIRTSKRSERVSRKTECLRKIRLFSSIIYFNVKVYLDVNQLTRLVDAKMNIWIHL